MRIKEEYTFLYFSIFYSPLWICRNVLFAFFAKKLCEVFPAFYTILKVFSSILRSHWLLFFIQSKQIIKLNFILYVTFLFTKPLYDTPSDENLFKIFVYVLVNMGGWVNEYVWCDVRGVACSVPDETCAFWMNSSEGANRNHWLIH